MDEQYNIHARMIRQVARMIVALRDISENWTGIKPFDEAMRFVGHSMTFLLRTSDQAMWDRAKLKDNWMVDRITRDTELLIWMALALGRYVNNLRELSKKKAIDWEKRAREIDKEEIKANAKE